MKKNLLTIIILALLVVNLALTGIMMFSTISVNSKTNALIDDIATVLALELNTGSEDGEEVTGPSILDLETYNIADEMVIALQGSGDGQDHFALCSVSISIDMTNEDYEKYQPLIASNESKIKSVIIDVVGRYTKDNLMSSIGEIESEVLSRVQELFGSDFIYEVYFRDIKCQ